MTFSTKLFHSMPILRAVIATMVALAAAPASAQVTAFNQAVAEAAAKDPALAAFYKANDYNGIWTGAGKNGTRLKAFMAAVAKSGDHGLPSGRYDPAQIMARIETATSNRDMGLLEVELSRQFLQYAADVQTGVLTPSKVESGIVRIVPLRDRAQTLAALVKSSPAGFIRSLPPASPEYVRLMKEKMGMERLLTKGGFGASVGTKSLKPGQAGPQVVALRDRLAAMGYLRRSATQTYDASIQGAVQQFQLDNGLNPDGVAGEGTIVEINKPLEARLQSVIVAMERERWMNQPLGKRHVMVNITDFTARIINNGKVEFQTRSVVGKNASDMRTPEFSDVMEFMVINPSWNVPRSITIKEYLPLLQKNPNAVSHLKVVDGQGRVLNRGAVNFAQYSAKTFPFNLKQPPSDGNALGLVKFMFPNKYNIYLHDTPSKNLFGREVRAFSHGCVRLADPFDFAYALLSQQTGDPQGLFQSRLKTGVESVVALDPPLPVHIDYRTAWTSPKGRMNYRRDIYGRDAAIFAALAKAGVALRAIQG